MKKVYLFLIAFSFCFCLHAQNRTEQEAESIAQQFLQSRRTSQQAKSDNPSREQSDLTLAHKAKATNGGYSYYIFNRQGGGFVIVSGDNRTTPILGYSEKDSLDITNIPDNFRYWLDSYASQITSIEEGLAEVRKTVTTSASPILPLLQSKWDQLSPYNLQCPINPNTKDRYITGCVATALAQVLYYYKWPEHCPSIPSYTPKSFSSPLPKLPAVDFNWGEMKKSYNYDETGESATAVAQLMRYCGQAMKMNYNSSGSGAYLDPEVFKEIFDYSDDMHEVIRNKYSSDAWETLIYQELAAGRPVLYSGQSSSSGHQFICDGYDGNGLFHINWGWSGSYDNYFVLSIANPYTDGRDGYSYGQTAIVNIEPKSTPSDYTIINLNIPEDIIVNEDVEITVALTNKGTTSRERIYFWLNNNGTWERTASVNATIEAGKKGIASFSFTPTAVGTFEVKITSDTEGKVVKATRTIQVAEPVEKIVDNFIYKCNEVTKNAILIGQVNNNVTNVIIPETFTADNATYTVKGIGKEAFWGNYYIEQLTLPSTLTKIEKDAFLNCKNLKMIISHIDHPFTIDDDTFSYRYWNEQLSDIIIEPSAAILYVPIGSKSEYEAITGWTRFSRIGEGEPKEYVVNSLKYLLYPDIKTAMVINDESYKELKTINIPAQMQYKGVTYQVVSVGKRAFYSCYKLSSVTIPSSIKSIGDDAFESCSGIKELIVPNGCESIGPYAFAYCYALEKITLPSTLTNIGNYAFYRISILHSVISHKSNPCEIAANVFATSSSWSSAEQKYDYQPSSATLFVPEGTTSIYEAKGWSQFAKISEGEPVETMIGGLKYQLDSNDRTATVINDESYANLETASIPSQVQYNGITYQVVTVGKRAFMGCNKLTSITLPSTLTHIEDYAFYHSGIKELFIPKGCESIGPYAFAYCYALEKITLPSTLTNIGNYAFYRISILHSVISHKSNPCEIAANVFATSSSWNSAEQKYDYQPSSATLFVPEGTTSVYEANGWNQFARIVPLTDEEMTDIKSIRNSQLTIENEAGAWYTLDGRKLSGKPAQKGIYIHNGKKVAIK